MSTAITRFAFASARSASRRIREVRQGVGAEQDQAPDGAVGSGAEDCGGIQAAGGRHLTPVLGERIATLVKCGSPRKQPGRHPHVDGAAHVRDG